MTADLADNRLLSTVSISMCERSQTAGELNKVNNYSKLKQHITRDIHIYNFGLTGQPFFNEV